jgi:hypothetical protein
MRVITALGMLVSVTVGSALPALMSVRPVELTRTVRGIVLNA